MKPRHFLLPESFSLPQPQGLNHHPTVGSRVLPTNTKDWRLTLVVWEVYKASSGTLDFLFQNCIWAGLRLIIRFKHPCFAYEVRTVAMGSRRNKLQSAEFTQSIPAEQLFRHHVHRPTSLHQEHHHESYIVFPPKAYTVCCPSRALYLSSRVSRSVLFIHSRISP